MAPTASVTLVRTVSFSIYQRAKYAYSGWIKRTCGFDVLDHVNRKGTYPNLYSVACFGAAGATAGSCITVVACPFELTKLSAQVSVLLSDQKKLAETNCRVSDGHAVAASYQNKGTFKTMRNIIRHRGVFGLYTGFNLHLCEFPAVLLRLSRGGSSGPLQARSPDGKCAIVLTMASTRHCGNGHLLHGVRERQAARNNVWRRQPDLEQALGGSFGRTLRNCVLGDDLYVCPATDPIRYANTSADPIDSAKSIYQRNSLLYSRGQQVEPPPKIAFFRKHMYRGLGVSMGRSCVVNALFFSAFEFMKKHVNSLDDE